MSTVKFERKQRRKRLERRADEELLTEAFKALGLPVSQRPDEQVRVLVAFVERLRAIQVELVADFGSEAELEAKKINFDIQRAISMARRLRVTVAEPKRA